MSFRIPLYDYELVILRLLLNADGPLTVGELKSLLDDDESVAVPKSKLYRSLSRLSTDPRFRLIDRRRVSRRQRRKRYGPLWLKAFVINERGRRALEQQGGMNAA